MIPRRIGKLTIVTFWLMLGCGGSEGGSSERSEIGGAAGASGAEGEGGHQAAGGTPDIDARGGQLGAGGGTVALGGNSGQGGASVALGGNSGWGGAIGNGGTEAEGGSNGFGGEVGQGGSSGGASAEGGVAGSGGVDLCLPGVPKIEGTPCDGPDVVCGSCTDPCVWCNLMACISGTWTRFEAPPDPELCGQGGTGGEGGTTEEGGASGEGGTTEEGGASGEGGTTEEGGASGEGGSTEEGGASGEGGSGEGGATALGGATGMGGDGGICRYESIPGTATIDSIEEASASDGTLCLGEGNIVRYSFAPEDGTLDPSLYDPESYGFNTDRFQRLTIPDPLFHLPSSACLELVEMSVGDAFSMVRAVQIQGACTPLMDSFEPAPLASCVGMCQ